MRARPAIIAAAIVLFVTATSKYDVFHGRDRQAMCKTDAPITKLGRSMMSLRIEKQNVHGTGAPLGLRSTQCEYTDCVVFSNA